MDTASSARSARNVTEAFSLRALYEEKQRVNPYSTTGQSHGRAGQSQAGLQHDRPGARSSLLGGFSQATVTPAIRSSEPHQYPVVDVVSAGHLRYAEVAELFVFFFEHMNPLIGILDPILHGDPGNCRTRSSLLFSAIITAVCQVRRHSKHHMAAQTFGTMLGSAFEKNQCSLEFVQALSLSVFWRSPEDDSGWRRIGLAIRMAYELGLHDKGAYALPTDENRQRERLNEERTWLQLCCSDINFSLQSSLPAMIDHNTAEDPTIWVGQHSFMASTPSEHILAPSLTFLYLTRLHADLARQAAMGSSVSQQLAALLSKHRNWQLLWLVGDAAPLSLSQLQRSVLQFASNHLAFKITELDAKSTDNFGILSEHCVDQVYDVISAFLAIAQLQALPYCQDMVYIGLASSVVWLCNHLASSTNHNNVYTAYKRIRDVIDVVTAPQEQSTITMTQLGKFLRFLCRNGPPTRRNSTAPLAQTSHGDPMTDYETSSVADTGLWNEEFTPLWTDINTADFDLFVHTLELADNLGL